MSTDSVPLLIRARIQNMRKIVIFWFTKVRFGPESSKSQIYIQRSWTKETKIAITMKENVGEGQQKPMTF